MIKKIINIIKGSFREFNFFYNSEKNSYNTMKKFREKQKRMIKLNNEV